MNVVIEVIGEFEVFECVYVYVKVVLVLLCVMVVWLYLVEVMLDLE